LSIKNIFDKNGIDYSTSTIIQASQLKLGLKKLQLKESDVTIVSFDAVEMYPSIKYKLVKKAIDYFAKDLDVTLKGRSPIRDCLDMIKFGMGNTLLTFVDKYYKYGGNESVEEHGLTISRYESAWLANLIVAYILECAEMSFDNARYKGIYRDDGLCGI